MIATVEGTKEPKSFASIVQQFLEKEKLAACFGIGSFQDRIVIIGRSVSKDVLDVGSVCKRFGGGGHFCAASAGCTNTTISEVTPLSHHFDLFFNLGQK